MKGRIIINLLSFMMKTYVFFFSRVNYHHKEKEVKDSGVVAPKSPTICYTTLQSPS